jgi:hypothetical protein
MPTKKRVTAGSDTVHETLSVKKRREAKKSAEVEKAPTSPKRRTRRKVDSVAPVKPTWEEIAVRAYYLSEERVRCGRAGSSEGDWIEAERILMRERGA